MNRIHVPLPDLTEVRAEQPLTPNRSYRLRKFGRIIALAAFLTPVVNHITINEGRGGNLAACPTGFIAKYAPDFQRDDITVKRAAQELIASARRHNIADSAASRLFPGVDLADTEGEVMCNQIAPNGDRTVLTPSGADALVALAEDQSSDRLFGGPVLPAGFHIVPLPRYV